MSILPFDTLAYSKRLQEKGMPSSQAEEIVTVFREVLDQKDLATKADVQVESERIRSELRAEIEKVRSELKTDIEKVRSELKTDIERLQGNTRVEIERLRTDIEKFSRSQLKWFVGISIGVVAMLMRTFHLLG